MRLGGAQEDHVMWQVTEVSSCKGFREETHTATPQALKQNGTQLQSAHKLVTTGLPLPPQIELFFHNKHFKNKETSLPSIHNH